MGPRPRPCAKRRKQLGANSWAQPVGATSGVPPVGRDQSGTVVASVVAMGDNKTKGTTAVSHPAGASQSVPGPRPAMATALRLWTARQWATAAVGAVVTALVIGLPTDVIPNPFFGRPVDVTWWSPWVLVITAVLGGMVLATYVAMPRLTATQTPASIPSPVSGPAPGPMPAAGAADGGPAGEATDVGSNPMSADRPARLASVGGLLGFLAVGCPVCNKLVVVALGTTGAMSWFAPIQPILAVASVVVLAIALRTRLRGQVSCPVG